MDFIDFILFPVYLLIFFFIVRRRLKKITDPVLAIYYKRAFLIRILSCLAFSIFIVFISIGDSFSIYFTEAKNIFQLSLKDPSIISRMIFIPVKDIDPTLFTKETGGAVVFFDENNYMIVRLSAIVLFFSFGKYLIANLFFSMLALEGCWRLYRFFYDQYPELHKEFAYAILYLPTFVFWSSGISKEVICISGIGFITYGLYSIFIKKASIGINVLLVLFFTYLLVNVKIYILLSYIPFLVYYIVMNRILIIQNSLFKILIGPIAVVLVLAGFAAVVINNEDELGLYAVNDLTQSIQTQQYNFQMQENVAESNFQLGAEFDGTTAGFAKVIPFAVSATLFRPFLWESKKLSTLLSSLESLVFMFLTLYVVFKAGLFTFFKLIFQKPIITYSFFFAFLFSSFIGATTLNFGSLVRYKIPCLPFYIVSLFLILYFAGQKKKESLIKDQALYPHPVIES